MRYDFFDPRYDAMIILQIMPNLIQRIAKYPTESEVGQGTGILKVQQFGMLNTLDILEQWNWGKAENMLFISYKIVGYYTNTSASITSIIFINMNSNYPLVHTWLAFLDAQIEIFEVNICR